MQSQFKSFEREMFMQVVWNEEGDCVETEGGTLGK
jgi:hypothetical protein